MNQNSLLILGLLLLVIVIVVMLAIVLIGRVRNIAPNSATSNSVSPGILKGRVSGLQQRYEWAGRQMVWDFRMERVGVDGRPLPRIAVQMRGRTMDGSLSQGDWVELRRRWHPGKIVHATNLYNLTTSAVVSVRGPHGRIFRRVFAMLAVLAFLGWLLWVGSHMLFLLAQ